MAASAPVARPARSSSACPGRSRGPASTKRRSASPCDSFSSWPGRGPSVRCCSAARLGRPGAGALEGSRAGDARCLHLRPRSDGVGRNRIRDLPPLDRRAAVMKPEPIWFTPPPPPTRPPAAPARPAAPPISVVIDGQPVTVADGSTILEACRARGTDIPTLCFLPTLTPVNVCRVCVVEVAGSRVLVPACSRRVEPGMTILTESERVRVSRRMVIELLASSVDLSTAPGVDDLVTRYGAQPARYGPPAAPAAEGERDSREPGHHEAPEGEQAETVAQP